MLVLGLCVFGLTACGEVGPEGPKGDQGLPGEPGQDGHTPVIAISSDGYWVIDGVKTDIKAEGQKGEDGSGVLTGNGPIKWFR